MRADGAELMLVGESLERAQAMQYKAKVLGWRLIANEAAVRAAGAPVQIGDRWNLLDGVDKSFDVVEITGWAGASPEAASPPAGAVLKPADWPADDTSLMKTAPLAGTSSAAFVCKGKPIAIDGYRLVRKLGEGGASEVFLAEHLADGTSHVLKVIEFRPGAQSELAQRFALEHAIISKIEHRHVARVFSRGHSANHAYIAMEYFPRGDLRKLLSNPLAHTRAIGYLKQTGLALEAIHKRGVVHRDVKPDNLMLREDESIALTDFGIARDPAQRVDATAHGEILGTPYYLSPEQASGQAIDHRSDYYNLGAMLFEMLTGAKPYSATSMAQLLDQHVNAPVPKLPEHAGQYQLLIESLMAKKREDRIGSANELFWAIRACSVMSQ
jgi:serine/threonine-protein kinase PpkA